MGKDDELSNGLGESEVSIEYACNGLFLACFHSFIESLFIEHLLCARRSWIPPSWSCPSRQFS